MEQKFGSIPVTAKQQQIINVLLHTFTDYSYRYQDPSYFKNVSCNNGSLTDIQWELVDELSVIPDKKPTLMDLVHKFEKNSISSVQKPRDMARKKIIEAFITVALVLNNEDILKYFIGEVL